MPEKQKKAVGDQNESQILMDTLANINQQPPNIDMPSNTPKNTVASPLPQIPDLTIPHLDKQVLIQDLATLADQNFHTGMLPDSQKYALTAIIDYVKRKGINITIDQEVYEWLYHMASNQKYYYSRAKKLQTLV